MRDIWELMCIRNETYTENRMDEWMVDNEIFGVRNNETENKKTITNK